MFQYRNLQIKTEDMPKIERPAETPECFAVLALWARGKGLPRFVFVSGELKPIYVNFLNPLSVDALAKLTKTVPAFRIAEMMPTRNDLVFADPMGAFTAEFRMSFIANQQQGQTS